VHGLAFLHLDGKFDTSTPTAVSGRVRADAHPLTAITTRAVSAPKSVEHTNRSDLLLLFPPAMPNDQMVAEFPCRTATSDCQRRLLPVLLRSRRVLRPLVAAMVPPPAAAKFAVASH
jgi:hypothetical protein